MANDLISRNDLLAEYDRVHIGEPGKARKLIENAPTVDAVEVVHGRWELIEKAGMDYWCCSVFCPGFLSVWKSNLTNCFVYKCV